MKSNVFALAVFAVVCFSAGLFLGSRVNDHWKVVQHDNCMQSIRVEVPQPTHTCFGCVQPRSMQYSVQEQRHLALSAAFQEIERCDSLSGLATLDGLTAQRLDEVIRSRY